MQFKAIFVTFGLVFFIALPAVSKQQPTESYGVDDRAEVLVLGVYHMNNPASDVFNVHSDDVLVPKRQSEIAQVITVLKEFQPTKIAVEADFNNNRIVQQYADYLADQHELTRNETQQLGFRLAKQFGHENIYPVDVNGEFPYKRLIKYAKATGRETEFAANSEKGAAEAESKSAYFASHTILENLLYMNSDENSDNGVADYFELAEWGEPWDWAGADLVSDWFRRNMRIYTNIVQLVDSPDERVLVIYGAGHLGWLQYAFDSNPNFRLRKLAEFAR